VAAKKKITLIITDEQHERLNTIAQKLGITTTELLRRYISLGYTLHDLIADEEGDIYLCTKGGKNFVQKHILDKMMY